jgi:hypothetical protein
MTYAVVCPAYGVAEGKEGDKKNCALLENSVISVQVLVLAHVLWMF